MRTGAMRWLVLLVSLMGAFVLVSPSATAAPPPFAPVGHLDSVKFDFYDGLVTVKGWAYVNRFGGGDPRYAQGTTPINILDTWHGRTAGTSTGTTEYRADVDRNLHIKGGHWGFDGEIPVDGVGAHHVCVVVVDIPPNGGMERSRTSLGCLDVTVPAPTGHLDKAQMVGRSIKVAGWAGNPLRPGYVNAEGYPNTQHGYWLTNVDVYVTGPKGRVGVHATAGLLRNDVYSVLTWPGTYAGFSATVPTLGAGTNKVCAFALRGTPDGSNALIGCVLVKV